MSQQAIVGKIMEPELRFTPGGKAVVNFSVLLTGPKGDDDKRPGFFQKCVAWEQMAENVAESLEKGDRVVVFGRITPKEWETRDGTKVQETVLTAEAIGPDLRFGQATPERDGGPSGASGSRPPVDDDDDVPF